MLKASKTSINYVSKSGKKTHVYVVSGNKKELQAYLQNQIDNIGKEFIENILEFHKGQPVFWFVETENNKPKDYYDLERYKHGWKIVQSTTQADLPTSGELCSGSNPCYVYKASINNGVVSIHMRFNDKWHDFTTTDKYRVATVVQEYYEKNKSVFN